MVSNKVMHRHKLDSLTRNRQRAHLSHVISVIVTAIVADCGDVAVVVVNPGDVSPAVANCGRVAFFIQNDDVSLVL